MSLTFKLYSLASLSKILQQETQMIVNSVEEILNVNNPYTYFRCGCGEEFEEKVQFKEHSLLIHQGQYVFGGTHYITKFTMLVMPVAQSRQRNRKGTKIMENPEKVTLKQSSRINNPGKSQIRTNKETKQKKKSITPELAKSQVIQEANEESIEWNGFRLVTNKKCFESPYFCGACSTIFTEPEEFIIHCIEICQELKNKKSSHFIGCILDSQNTVRFSQQEPKNTGIRISQKEGTVDPVKQRSEHPILNIYLTQSSHLHIPLFCGACNMNYNCSHGYLLHMYYKHSQIIGKQSSHVILRIGRWKRKPNVYLSPLAKQTNEGAIYFCPCKPEFKMVMSKLIKHVYEVHKGISPIYY